MLDKNSSRKIIGLERATYKWLDVKNAKEGLEKLVVILEENNIVSWLEYGTLLGAKREKDFIRYDYDVDLSMKIEDACKLKKLREVFIDNGFLVEIQKVNNLFVMCVFLYNGVKIDLYIWYKYKNKYKRVRSFYNNKYRYAEISSKYYDSLNKILFLGKEYNIPNFTDEYLSIIYKNWTVPTVGPQGDGLITKNSEEFLI